LVPAIATTFVALAPRRASSSSFVPTATAALLALVVIVHDGLVLRDVRRFNEVDMAGFAEVVDAIPEAARVLPVLSHQSSAYVVTPFPHMGSYAVIRRDAQVPHGLMHTRDFVVQWRQRFPAIPWGDPRRVRDAELLREYDFVLVRHPPGSRFRRFGDAPPERLVSVIERGDFSLLRVATPSEQR
jgi:hypothetical protein